MNEGSDDKNGAIDASDLKRLARGASTLKSLASMLGGGKGASARRSAPRTAARKARTGRRAGGAGQVELPGLGKVPASTVKKWLPTIGGLVLGRMLTRPSSGGGSSRRRRAAAETAQGDAEAARTAAPAANPWTKWIVLAIVLGVVLWWLADGGAQTCVDALRRLAPPPAGAPAAAAEPAAPDPATAEPATPAKKPAKRAAKKAEAAPASPATLTDGLWWEGRGVVVRVLPDDETPPRHQRFFLRDDRGRELFFAHNVDAAPRVPDLREGDELSFRGEWRDNERGGAMHWTHRAESGRRRGGWLERDGVRYE